MLTQTVTDSQYRIHHTSAFSLYIKPLPCCHFLRNKHLHTHTRVYEGTCLPLSVLRNLSYAQIQSHTIFFIYNADYSEKPFLEFPECSERSALFL